MDIKTPWFTSARDKRSFYTPLHPGRGWCPTSSIFRSCRGILPRQ